MTQDFYDRLQKETESERNTLIGLPFIQLGLKGELSKDEYLSFLGQAFHHVRHTVPLLMSLGSRLGGQYQWLQSAIVEYVEEEVGHEEWILNDIAACGENPERYRNSTPHAETEVMVAYAYHQIDRGNPLGFFGMVHVLEGTSVSAASAAAAAIQKSLSLPDKAFSYLNSHGSLDLEHVEFFENLMNRIENPKDQKAIIHCAKRFYRLYGDVFRSLPLRANQKDLTYAA